MVSIIAMMDTIDDVPGAVRRRRRTWSQAEKEQIVAASYARGASVSEVARRHDINANMVFTWRRQGGVGAVGGEASAPALVPVTVMPTEPAAPAAASSTADGAQRAGMMEIDLGDGRRVRVGRDVDGTALRRVLSALERR
ncbi:MAG: transposase [Proteobacteria bacterium]|nr:transposase [Pseudomonadota bacterium]MDA0952452.1 transposase [Pseudomonadota bacterium]